MKVQVPNILLIGRCHRAAMSPRAGFTLPELLVSITVFIFVVSGVIFANIYGLKMFQITEHMLSATDAGRKTIGRMTDEIRTCNSTWIGNVKNGEFVALLDGEKQEGSGLLIQPTTNAAQYIIYFVKPSDQSFRRTTSTPDTATILAEPITNTLVFTAQDRSGKVLTNNLNNRIIHIDLEFYQPKRYMVIGDYYKMETSVTRRIEQP